MFLTTPCVRRYVTPVYRTPNHRTRMHIYVTKPQTHARTHAHTQHTQDEHPTTRINRVRYVAHRRVTCICLRVRLCVSYVYACCLCGCCAYVLSRSDNVCVCVCVLA